MLKKSLHIGFGHYLPVNKIIAIASYYPHFDGTIGNKPLKPLRALKMQAEEKGKFIKTNNSRRTRSLIFMGNGFIFASAFNSETLAGRLEKINGNNGELYT